MDVILKLKYIVGFGFEITEELAIFYLFPANGQ